MRVPYPMVAAVHNLKRHSNMAVALHYKFPRLRPVPIDDSRSLSIACYGPSLLDTWTSLQPPIMSMSGSLHFLASKGIIPDYHIDMDPRENKLLDISNPVIDGPHYLMSSLCPTGTWEILRGQRVTIWHAYSCPETYDWIAVNDPDQLVIRGGSTVGLTALHVGGLLGYRHFEIHGMDGSFSPTLTRHAGPHTGHTQKPEVVWAANHKKYRTSKIMANAVEETLQAIANYPMFCVFHGEGLTQGLIRKRNYPNACCADEIEKAAQVRSAKVEILHTLQPDPNIDPASTWDKLYGSPLTPTGIHDLQQIASSNQSLRQSAKYNTGTVTFPQMTQLACIATTHRPRIIIEIGTFIGNSAMAFQYGHPDAIIHTCDRSNDCLPSTPTLITYPGLESTKMLSHLLESKIQADLFFFDGRIQPNDLDLIRGLSHPGTIYLFDDYRGVEKGVVNARILGTLFPKSRVLIEPDIRIPDSTLAAIIPVELLSCTSDSSPFSEKIPSITV